MASRRSKWIIIVLVLVGVAAVAASQLGGRDKAVEVRIEEVASRDLVASVTATGKLEPQRSVDIASDITGRIIELPVEEGDWVERGQLLLRIEPTQYEASVQRNEAMLSSAQAQALQAAANRDQAKRALDRALLLRASDPNLVSDEELETAQTNYDVGAAMADAQTHQVSQAQAGLREAEEELSKTIIRSPMSGQITRLDVEEGETALASTFSRDTGRLMTVSDLSVMLVNVRVDETDVVRLTEGDSAEIEIDAFPDTTFTGKVTKISQSAISVPASGGTGDRAVDYDVEITLSEPPANVRTDLSATAKVITNTRDAVLSIPIIALTMREHHAISTEDMPQDTTETETMGVFVVLAGLAQFHPVKIGITGEEHFEVLEGLALGDSIVSGPYQTIRDLGDSTMVRAMEDTKTDGNGT